MWKIFLLGSAVDTSVVTASPFLSAGLPLLIRSRFFHCFKGNLRVSTLQSVSSHYSLPKDNLPDEMGNQRPKCSGSAVQSSNITFQLEMRFEFCVLQLRHCSVSVGLSMVAQNHSYQ